LLCALGLGRDVSKINRIYLRCLSSPKSSLFINLTTAKAVGIELPLSLLMCIDEAIATH